MHGNGNDFIFIEAQYYSKKFFTITQIQKMCHRQFGIGADGIVFYDFGEENSKDFLHHSRSKLTSYKSASDEAAQARVDAMDALVHEETESQRQRSIRPIYKKLSMLILNSDGSEATTCGNALRCLGLLAWKQKFWDGSSEMPVYPLKTTKTKPNYEEAFAKLISLKNDFVFVDMGKQKNIFEVNFNVIQKNLSKEFQNDFEMFTCCYFVELANPHVVFILNQKYPNEKFSVLGKYLQELLPQIDNRIPISNISFLVKNENNFSIQVYERGAGVTYCCGSASVACAIVLNYLGHENKFMFEMLGGKLTVENKMNVWCMGGPAELVFRGKCHTR